MMLYAQWFSALRSLPVLSKRMLFVVVLVVLALLLLVGPQLWVYACEAGTGGAGCNG